MPLKDNPAPKYGYRKCDGDQPRQEHDDDHDRSDDQHHRMNFDGQHLHPDQQKKNGIQYLIDQFPELTQVILRHTRHGFIFNLVPDYKPPNHHGQGPRDMQMAGYTISPRHNGNRYQYFYLIIIDGAQSQKPGISQYRPEQYPAQGFLNKELYYIQKIDMQRSAPDYFFNTHKEHDRNTIVKQGLSGNLCSQ